MKKLNVTSLLLYLFALCVATFGTGVACILRDGLGSDSIESHGFQAAFRVIEGSWLFILVSCLLAFLGYRAKVKPHTRQSRQGHAKVRPRWRR